MRAKPVLTVAALWIAACGSPPAARQESIPLPATLRAPAQGGLRLTGKARGPLAGLGPALAIDAWIRSDGWMRAELRYESPDGRPAHDVLVWTPEVALLIDHRRGDLSVLGDDPGVVQAEGTGFRAAHVVWLGLGRAVPEMLDAHWERHDSQWRGRLGTMALRLQSRGAKGRWTFSELAWKGEDDAVRGLRAEPSGFVDTPWGPIPSRLSLDGTALEARVQVDWSVQSYASIGDTLFDPLWRP